MRITIEEDNLESIQINDKNTRTSQDICNKKIDVEYISNDISIELIDNTLILFNSCNNLKQKIRIYLKKKEVDKLKSKLFINK
jgi:hypothetical protein